MALNPEYAGTWEDAEGKISSTGFLEVNEDNLKLRLIGLHGTEIEEGVPLTGELSGIKIKAFDRFSIDKQIENLFSVSISGKYISLFNLRLRRSNSTIFAPPEETYYEFEAGYGLFGDRIIENKDRAIFTRSRFHIPDLHLVSSGSRFEHEYSNRRRISKSINILKDGTSDVFRIPEENIRIELYNGYHETSSRGLVKILPLTTITIVSRRGLTYEKHLEKFLRLENLISFMRGGPTDVEKVYLNTRKIIHRSKSVKIYEEFELISRLSRRRNKKEDYIIR